MDYPLCVVLSIEEWIWMHWAVLDFTFWFSLLVSLSHIISNLVEVLPSQRVNKSEPKSSLHRVEEKLVRATRRLGLKPSSP